MRGVIWKLRLPVYRLRLYLLSSRRSRRVCVDEDDIIGPLSDTASVSGIRSILSKALPLSHPMRATPCRKRVHQSTCSPSGFPYIRSSPLPSDDITKEFTSVAREVRRRSGRFISIKIQTCMPASKRQERRYLGVWRKHKQLAVMVGPAKWPRCG